MSPAFPQRSQPSLLTTAARGGLRPAPDCRPRRALLHLSYSSAPFYADGAFVTHAPKRTSSIAIRGRPSPLDPSFEGSAVLTTDSEGRYRFKTIKPAAYPAGPNRMRPAHIHFQVSGRQDKIVTQMYFEGDPHNKTDPFLNSVGETGRQELLVKKLLDPSPDFEPS